MRSENSSCGILAEYLSKGQIRPSTYSYRAAILFARKNDGTLRICIDYRALNQQTKPDTYPLLRINHLLERLDTDNCFSSIDLHISYY